MNNDVRKLYLGCNCGCGESVLFINDFGCVYVEPLMSYFCALQGNQYLKTRKTAKDKGCVFDIVVTRTQLEELEEFLMFSKFDKDSDFSCDIKFDITKLYSEVDEKDIRVEEYFSFEILLKKDIDEYDRKEFFRLFDISLNEDETKSLIDIIRVAYTQKGWL